MAEELASCAAKFKLSSLCMTLDFAKVTEHTQEWWSVGASDSLTH